MIISHSCTLQSIEKGKAPNGRQCPKIPGEFRNVRFEIVLYEFCSKNTLDRISLHDCKCSRMFFDGSSIVLDMEWMEILPSHPNNPYGKAHQSKEGRLILEKPSLEKCTLLPCDDQEKQPRDLALEEIDVSNYEVLSFDVESLKLSPLSR